MQPAISPRWERWLLTALLAVGTPACGTLSPPLTFQSAPRTSKAESAEVPVSVQAAEGRPQGLVLRLAVDLEPREGARLELRRAIDDEAPKRLRTIDIGGRIAEKLRDSGLEFLDRSVEAGARHRYQLLYSDESGRTVASPVLALTWHEPPPPPSGVTARADTGRAVELRWKSGQPTAGALLFRRDVLDTGSSTKRLGKLGPGAGNTYIDRTVAPGRVYAYRIALAIERDGYTQYGPPSEPLYVSVPETGKK